MDRRAVSWLLHEGEDWVDEGLLKRDQWQRIAARYDADAAGPSWGIRVLYALGGALLAAAVFAFWVFLQERNAIPDDEWVPWLMFLGFGALWLGLGAWTTRSGNSELSEAFLVAGIIQTAALAAPDPGPDGLAFLAPLAAVAVLVWQRMALIVPTAALVALQVTLPVSFERVTSDHETFTILWMLTALGLLVGWIAWSRAEQVPWRVAGSTIAAFAACLSWVIFADANISDAVDFEGNVEVFAALFFGAVTAAGVFLKDRAVALVGGLALTADAIVFAFDLGGVTWGLATLIALSLGLLGLGTMLRQQGRKDGPAA